MKSGFYSVDGILAINFWPSFAIDDAGFKLPEYACATQSEGHIEGHATVQACWDADRLDLWRVWLVPSPARTAGLWVLNGKLEASGAKKVGQSRIFRSIVMSASYFFSVYSSRVVVKNVSKSGLVQSPGGQGAGQSCVILSAGHAFGQVSERLMTDAFSALGTAMLMVFLVLSWFLSRKLERIVERS